MFQALRRHPVYRAEQAAAGIGRSGVRCAVAVLVCGYVGVLVRAAWLWVHGRTSDPEMHQWCVGACIACLLTNAGLGGLLTGTALARERAEGLGEMLVLTTISRLEFLGVRIVARLVPVLGQYLGYCMCMLPVMLWFDCDAASRLSGEATATTMGIVLLPGVGLALGQWSGIAHGLLRRSAWGGAAGALISVLVMIPVLGCVTGIVGGVVSALMESQHWVMPATLAVEILLVSVFAYAELYDAAPRMDESLCPDAGDPARTRAGWFVPWWPVIKETNYPAGYFPPEQPGRDADRPSP